LIFFAGLAALASTPRFLVDAMLGRLARWLRVLGMDTAELRPQRSLLVEADAPLLQLRQVVAQVGVAPPVELFTRCLVCNAELLPAGTEDWKTRIPPASRELPGPVRCCPSCKRVYWPGSHTRRMRAALARAFPDWPLHSP
jgi:uncharacterized protein with PIN domain